MRDGSEVIVRHVLLLSLLATPPAMARPSAKTPPPDLETTAATLLGQALASDEAYTELRELCDTIGHRLSGSPQLERAVAWGAEHMRADGLTVSLEPVEVPHWIRGEARLTQVSPIDDELGVIALGGTISTPPGGIEADVLVVGSAEELEARAEEAKGKIVLFDVPFTTYGETVRYRWDGANMASRAGAVASLVRSVTNRSLQSPHTGSMGYDDDVTPIPHAATTIEDATRLHRLQQAGITPRVRLELRSEFAETADSFNVIGELRGRERPDEVIVLGCHLDSWDVGQGAQDDGAGCVVVMEAVAQLAALPVGPRRTVRAVLYTNEENGLGGGKAYAAAHAGERIIAAVEDDTGSGAPMGFRVDARTSEGETDEAGVQRALEVLGPYTRLIAPTGADTLHAGYGGADIGPLVVKTGAFALGLDHDMTGYWPIHHTEADTFDKVDPAMVKRNVAAMTVLAWVLAELDSLSPQEN